MDFFGKRTIFSVTNRRKKSTKRNKSMKKSSSSSSLKTSPNKKYSPNTTMKRSSKRFLRKTKLPEKAHELEKQVSQLSKQANELFKKKPATLKENMTTIKVKNLDTGKVMEAFVLTDATNGKSMLLSLDTNRPVGKNS